MIQDSILVCSPDPRIPHTAYAQVSTLGLFNHLYLTYGAADELSANMENLSCLVGRQPTVGRPLGSIRKCQAFADAHDPITDKTVVRITINNLENPESSPLPSKNGGNNRKQNTQLST
jgi:hypothetical protein